MSRRHAPRGASRAAQQGARAGLTEAGLVDAGRTRTGTAGGPHPAGRADELAALLAAHVDRLNEALPALQAAAPTLARWGEELGKRLLSGNRLLAAGNGGSAAEAQHLTAELVGRFDGDRARCPRSRCTPTRPAPPSATTTASQVYAPGLCPCPSGRRLDVLTSGRRNSSRCRRGPGRRATSPVPGPIRWRMPASTPCASRRHRDRAGDALAALHMLCRVVERWLTPRRSTAGTPRPSRPRWDGPASSRSSRSCTRARARAYAAPCARAGCGMHDPRDRTGRGVSRPGRPATCARARRRRRAPTAAR